MSLTFANDMDLWAMKLSFRLMDRELARLDILRNVNSSADNNLFSSSPHRKTVCFLPLNTCLVLLLWNMCILHSLVFHVKSIETGNTKKLVIDIGQYRPSLILKLCVLAKYCYFSWCIMIFSEYFVMSMCKHDCLNWFQSEYIFPYVHIQKWVLEFIIKSK